MSAENPITKYKLDFTNGILTDLKQVDPDRETKAQSDDPDIFLGLALGALRMLQKSKFPLLLQVIGDNEFFSEGDHFISDKENLPSSSQN